MNTASRFFINKQSYKFTISNTMHKLPRTYRIPSFEECWTSSPRWRSERLMCLCFIHRIIHYYHFHQFSNWFHQLFNETQVNIFKITNTTWRYKRTPSLTYYHRHRASIDHRENICRSFGYSKYFALPCRPCIMRSWTWNLWWFFWTVYGAHILQNISFYLSAQL